MDAWEYCKTKEEELKQRGLEGWEVYAIYHYGTTTYYMKRKKNLICNIHEKEEN